MDEQLDMNEQLIVYQKLDGGIAVVIPAPEALKVLTIQQIAEKDIPEGRPFKIVRRSDFPTDRVFRDAWVIDPELLTDGFGKRTVSISGA